jgi:hypothetical protein
MCRLTPFGTGNSHLEYQQGSDAYQSGQNCSDPLCRPIIGAADTSSTVVAALNVTAFNAGR